MQRDRADNKQIKAGINRLKQVLTGLIRFTHVLIGLRRFLHVIIPVDVEDGFLMIHLPHIFQTKLKPVKAVSRFEQV
jgi:hypothetical protein